MSDGALNAAIARRREIETQLPALSAELKRLNVFIRQWFEMAGVQVPPGERRESNRRAIPRSPNPPKEDVVAVAVSVLREAGRPLRRAELLDALESRGVILNGKDPAMVLSTMLWRSQHCVTRTRAGYVPAIAMEARKGPDRETGLDGEAATARPEGIAQ